MGTGFSMDPSEYRSAANVIEGYGAMQADHGSALAAGTSTPLSASGTGIAGAISQIAQGTVQKIVTDVTSTTQGFANDTAAGLRSQAATMEHLETGLADHAKSIMDGTSRALPSLLGGGQGAGAGYGIGGGASLGSPLTSYGSIGADDAVSGSLATDGELGDDSLGGPADPSVAWLDEQGGEAAASGAVEASQRSAVLPFGELRGATGSAAAFGGAQERGQRPNYLRSNSGVADSGGDRVKAVIDEHLRTCGAAPIPFSANRLVCAKCGSVIEVCDAAALGQTALPST